MIVAYWKFARAYYVKNGQPTGTIFGIKVALRILRQSYGHTRATDFGPVALKSLQQKMIDLGQSRRYINDNVDRIRRAFKWACAEEMIPTSVHQSLITVAGLRKGRTEAREPAPIEPVDDAIVDATLPHLPTVVADMVRFQRLTGCRPAEVRFIRPCDVETSGEVWCYRPESHKTEHQDRDRVFSWGRRHRPSWDHTCRETVRHIASRQPTANASGGINSKSNERLRCLAATVLARIANQYRNAPLV